MRVVLFDVEIYVQWLRKRSKFAIFLHYYCNSFALMISVTVLPFLWLRMMTCIVSRLRIAKSAVSSRPQSSTWRHLRWKSIFGRSRDRTKSLANFVRLERKQFPKQKLFPSRKLKNHSVTPKWTDYLGEESQRNRRRISRMLFLT